MIECIIWGIFLVSLCFWITSFYAASSTRMGKKCTESTGGKLVKIISESRGDSGDWFLISYTVGEETIENQIPSERVETLTLASEIGTEATVWYDPNNPKHAVVGDTPNLSKNKESWLKTRKRCLKVMIICVIVALVKWGWG